MKIKETRFQTFTAIFDHELMTAATNQEAFDRASQKYCELFHFPAYSSYNSYLTVLKRKRDNSKLFIPEFS
jgi:hypothetical protein